MAGKALKIVKKKDGTKVSISGPMTIAEAADFREGLLKAFEAGKQVDLSLEGVTEADLTALQLLCSAHRTSVQKGIPFVIADMSEALSSIAELAGMLRSSGCVHDVAGTCVWKREA